MKLIIKSATLKGFKGARDLTVSFRDDVATIRGRNRTGKTTIADAITWCLFGKDSKGNAKFGIKTREKGEEVPHIEHSVTLSVTIDGTPHDIRRTLREKYDRDDRVTANTTEYHIDGTPYTAADFALFISRIAPEEVFRTLSTPSAFPMADWKQQRRFLVEMCGAPTSEEITAGDKKFSAIEESLRQQDIAQLMQHLAYQIRETKKQLDLIPVRIEEQKKVMPECDDSDEIVTRKTDIEQQLRQVTDYIQGLQSSNAESTQRLELQRQIDFQQKRLTLMRQSAFNEAEELYTRYDDCVRDAKARITAIEIEKNDISAKRNSLCALQEQAQRSLRQYETEKGLIRTQWAENTQLQFTPDEDSIYCPTCHQPLPPDKARETIAKARADFNLRRETKFRQLTEQAQTLKGNIQQAQEMVDEYTRQIKECADRLMTLANEAVKAKRNLDEIPMPPKAEELLAKNANYKQAQQRLQQKQSELEQADVAGTDQALIDAKAKQEVLRQQLSDIYTQTERARMKKKILENISQLEEQKKSIVASLDALERQKLLADEYQQRADTLLEERVNSRFSYVSFSLFRTYLNGTREPFCQCMHDGIPYADLNSADKLNAGIDIIRTLSQFYDVQVPLVIDNAESVNDILPSPSQQIRLYVSDDPALTIQ